MLAVAFVLVRVWLSDDDQNYLFAFLQALSALALVAFTFELYRLEVQREHAKLIVDTVTAYRPYDPDAMYWEIFFRLVNRGGRDTAIWPRETYLLGRNEKGQPVRVGLQIWVQDQYLQMEAAALPADDWRRFTDEDYVVRVGLLKAFIGRCPRSRELQSIAGRAVTLVITPVAGNPITAELRVA